MPLCIPMLIPTENISMYKIISECWLKKLTGVGLKPESPQKSPRTRASSVNKTIICLLLLNLSAFCSIKRFVSM